MTRFTRRTIAAIVLLTTLLVSQTLYPYFSRADDTDATTTDATEQVSDTQSDASETTDTAQTAETDTTQVASDTPALSPADDTTASTTDATQATTTDAAVTDTADATTTDEAAPPAEEDATTTDEVASTTADTDLDTASSTDATTTEDANAASITEASGGGGGGRDDETDATTTPQDATTTPFAITTSGTSTPATSTLSDIASTTEATTIDASTTPASTTPTIISGEAIALANILNIINSNFVNSNGIVFFSNLLAPFFGTLDFRNGNLFGSTTCGYICTDGSVGVNLTDSGYINNALYLSAISGNNAVTGNASAGIETGDAYAGVNLVNIANTNVINSNYLLVTLNAFGGVNGDIVFPSLSNFFSSIANGASSPASLSLTNTADVETNATTDANSGDNSIDATSSEIDSGSATSATNVFNAINANVGDSTVSILFRVPAGWAGQIFGAPPGLTWTEGADGSIYLFGTGSGGGAGGTASITSSSTAGIKNDVSVIALTGKNEITGANTGIIQTGSAYAGANIVNVANTNVVGRNWILAIINIFGDFKGNIAFGRPDLWVGGQAHTDSTVTTGSHITYTFTVINNGDSDASNVVLTDDPDRNHFLVTDSSLPYTEDGDALAFDLGTIPAGKAAEVTLSGTVADAGDDTDITNTVTAGEHETDNNAADNTDSVTVTTSHGGHHRALSDADTGTLATDLFTGTPPEDSLSALRPTATTTIVAGNRAEETLHIDNTGTKDSADVVVHDILRDPKGAVLHDETWDVGTIKAHEEVQLSYIIAFSPRSMAGIYTLSTVLLEQGADPIDFHHNGDIVVAAGHVEAAATTTPIVSPISSDITRAPENVQVAAAGGTHVPYAIVLYLLFLALLSYIAYRTYRHFRTLNRAR